MARHSGLVVLALQNRYSSVRFRSAPLCSATTYARDLSLHLRRRQHFWQHSARKRAPV